MKRKRRPPETVDDLDVGEIFLYRPWLNFKRKYWMATCRDELGASIDSIKAYGPTREAAIESLRAKYAARKLSKAPDL